MLVSVEESHIFFIYGIHLRSLLLMYVFFHSWRFVHAYASILYITVYIQCLTVTCLHCDVCISASARWVNDCKSLFVLNHKVISDFEQVILIKYNDQIINQMWLIAEQFEMRDFYFAYQICTLYENMY